MSPLDIPVSVSMVLLGLLSAPILWRRHVIRERKAKR